jgi:gas vesicle structural protein
MTATMPSANRAPHPSSLADVLDLVLDKGIVIDAYVRLALVGIEILTLDARVVIASVDTYLRFAEAVNRLDLQPREQAAGLPGLIEEMREGPARHGTKGAISGVRESAREVASSMRGRGDDDQQGEQEERRPRKAAAPRKAPARSRRTRSQDEG